MAIVGSKQESSDQGEQVDLAHDDHDAYADEDED